MDYDTKCPKCGTTKYANVHLKMMVNVCGHSLCENCIELLFAKGVGNCPTCDVLLKRQQFRIQLYDDLIVEKDLQIRKRLLNDIQMREEDFETLREFNDYLEKIEHWIDNLATDTNVAETNDEIDEFKQKYGQKIGANKSKKRMSKDLELIEQLLEEEKESDFERMSRNEIAMQTKKVIIKKDNIIDQLMESDQPAELILQNHQRQVASEKQLEKEIEEQRQEAEMLRIAAKRQQQNFTFSTGVKRSKAVEFDVNMLDAPQGERFVYRELKLSNYGSVCPTPRTVQSNNFMRNVRVSSQSELSGGFVSLFPCVKALQDAFIDLAFVSA